MIAGFYFVVNQWRVLDSLHLASNIDTRLNPEAIKTGPNATTSTSNISVLSGISWDIPLQGKILQLFSNAIALCYRVLKFWYFWNDMCLDWLKIKLIIDTEKKKKKKNGMEPFVPDTKISKYSVPLIKSYLISLFHRLYQIIWCSGVLTDAFCKRGECVCLCVCLFSHTHWLMNSSVTHLYLIEAR